MRIAVLVLGVVVWCSLAFSQVGSPWGTLSPTDSSSLNDGNSSLIRPFRNPSSRFQQVYSSNDFLGLGPGLIDRIFFRVDAPTGFDFSGVSSNLQIRLSTTLKGPDSLSPVFNENVGPNETLVFGPMNQFVMGRRDFGIFTVRLDFTTPFLYRPSDGNLLVDFRLNGGAAGILDAWDRVGDSVGSVSGNVNDISGIASTIGLAASLEGTVAIPEPSTYALLALGGIALFFFRKGRRPRT